MRRGRIAKATLWALIVLLGLSGSLGPRLAAQGAQDKNNNPPPEAEKSAKKAANTKLHITVTAGQPSQPVHAAHVDVSWEEDNVPGVTKITDQTGVVDFLDVTRGKVLIQVIAQHWQSSGVRCKLKKDTETVRITLVKQDSPPVAPDMTCEPYAQ
jgi:hypothetical protein